jgi:serine/threonine protein kinase
MSPKHPADFGAYRLIEELGRGTRTVVYRAVQTNLDRPVALKVLRRSDPETLQRFRDEVRLSAKLTTPGVRRIHEAGRTPQGYIYVAMEYMDRSLKQVLRERFAQKRTFMRDEVAALLDPIAQALDEMHRRNLVHLDIKPENILVSASGQAVLADFGISRRRGATTHEGTPLYMSPEQAAGDRPVGPWCDVYSLGVLAYEMLVGRTPFVSEMDMVLVRQHLQDTAPAPRKLKPDLDRDVNRLLLGTLSKDPRRRPESAMAFLTALREPRTTPLVQTLDRATRQVTREVRRRPYLALIPALGVVGVIILLGVLWGSASSPQPPTDMPPPPTRAVTAAAPIRPTKPPPTRARTPDRPPSPTVRPTSTSAPTPSKGTAPTGATSVTASATPTNLRPNGVGLSSDQKVVTLRWDGRLAAGQRYVIEICHLDDATSQCDGPMQEFSSTETRYTYDLPQGGRWRWAVRVEPGNAESEPAEFWLELYAP